MAASMTRRREENNINNGRNRSASVQSWHIIKERKAAKLSRKWHQSNQNGGSISKEQAWYGNNITSGIS